MHRLLDRITVRLGVVLITGTAVAQDTAIRGYDSVVVTTVIDHRFDPVFPDGSCKEGRDVTGQACLSSTEARDLQRRLRDPASYGATQAVTPVNELELLYYRKGRVKDHVHISLITHNLWATFPLRAQRQGDCLCKGGSGHCCTEGGIGPAFTEYLIGLCRGHGLEVGEW